MIDPGSKRKDKVLLSVALNDLQAGDPVVSIETQSPSREGEKSSEGNKLAGGGRRDADPAVIPAQKRQSFAVAVPFQVRVMTNVAVRIES
jgi:hypothetical protein